MASMSSADWVAKGSAGTGALLLTCVAEQGSASHPWFAEGRLAGGPELARNLADALYVLCAVHGRQPGLVETAIGHVTEDAARAWLASVGDAMIAERQLLARLAVAAGPVPGTPGGAASEAAVIAQRTALQTLAQSDRRGCALGAALAFAADWQTVRRVIDAAGERFGISSPLCPFADQAELLLVADDAGSEPAVERAMLFGAQQLAHQHRGLWDLIDARRQARLES